MTDERTPAELDAYLEQTLTPEALAELRAGDEERRRGEVADLEATRASSRRPPHGGYPGPRPSGPRA